MFEIRINDVSTIMNKVIISGKCKNELEFTSKLFDENGVEYLVTLPFVNYIVHPDPDYMTLEIKGVFDPYSLKGLVLRSLPQ
jgi:hypothetical protein